ncbi:MAG: hypothetical protein JW982_04440 [Spirochaetes bacterium]|nr:hypothetical protein [Spirochaetota bacterium]
MTIELFKTTTRELLRNYFPGNILRNAEAGGEAARIRNTMFFGSRKPSGCVQDVRLPAHNRML